MALRSIGTGNGVTDRLGIAARVGLAAFLPIGALARKLGHPLPDPARWRPGYRVRTSEGIFQCPGGPSPYFMAADPCYEAYLDSLFDEMAGGLFVDVGAHLGFITVRAARRLKGRGQVLAIEPHPDRFRCLLDNVTGNQLEGVRCLNYALGARNGHAALYEPDPSFGPHPLDVSLVPTAQPGRELKVPLRTLDDILTDEDIQNVSLIKLDVEGYEAEVLRGAQRTLQHGPRIVFEAHTPHEVAAVVDLLPGPVRLRQLDSANYLAETASATAEH